MTGGRFTAVAATLHPSHVAVSWGDGHESEFHPLWLRDNCPCTECRHPQTEERLFDVVSVAPDLRPVGLVLTPDVVAVTWPDGHVSPYATVWLRSHCSLDGYDGVGLDERVYWPTPSALEPVDRAYPALMDDDTALLAWLEQLWRTGVAMVRQTPADPTAGPALAQRVDQLRRNNFGEVFHVEAKSDPNNQAYTAQELPPHTDLVNYEAPPGVQFLHCLEAGAEGGESVLVDGFAAAEQLRTEAPDQWRLLTEVAVPFHFHDRTHDLRWRSPMIRLRPDGWYHEVRANQGLLAPLPGRADEVAALYDAIRAFSVVLRDPSRQLRFQLRPGDLMVFHNRRVLHGRAAFVPSGPRHLVGCYLDIDAVLSRIRVLRRPTTAA